MFKVTRWVVLPYVRRGDGPLERGDAQQFYTKEEALREASRLKRRRERVDVYEVTGWPVQDLWDRPKKLMSEWRK